jgi:hypothetical protein
VKFNGERHYLNEHLFASLRRARHLIAAWRDDYSNHRTNTSLDGLTRLGIESDQSCTKTETGPPERGEPARRIVLTTSFIASRTQCGDDVTGIEAVAYPGLQLDQLACLESRELPP